MPSLNVGWGGRIRTSGWRDQNPLPYHLATPQHFNHRAADVVGFRSPQALQLTLSVPQPNDPAMASGSHFEPETRATAQVAALKPIPRRAYR
jgi:hypothetical protein